MNYSVHRYKSKEISIREEKRVFLHQIGYKKVTKHKMQQANICKYRRWNRNKAKRNLNFSADLFKTFNETQKRFWKFHSKWVRMMCRRSFPLPSLSSSSYTKVNLIYPVKSVVVVCLSGLEQNGSRVENFFISWHPKFWIAFFLFTWENSLCKF